MFLEKYNILFEKSRNSDNFLENPENSNIFLEKSRKSNIFLKKKKQEHSSIFQENTPPVAKPRHAPPPPN